MMTIRNLNKRLRQLAVVVMTFIVFMTVPSQAAGTGRSARQLTGTEIKSLGSDISDAMELLEGVFERQYESAEDEIRNMIRKDNLDYEYTTESFYDGGNPFQEIDYEALIAAYAEILKRGRNGKGMLSGVPFLSMDVEKKESPDGSGKYGEVRFHVMDEDGLIRYYGYDPEDEDIKRCMDERIQIINEVLQGTDLRETVFIKTPDKLQSDSTDYNRAYAMISEGLSESSKERMLVVKTALSLLGKVPYEWGGKPAKAGYDQSWWTFNGNSGQQKGLDCSGFVQWVFMTAGYSRDFTDGLISTSRIRQNPYLQEITEDELQPGDIGLKNNTDSDINHTGIYLGNGLWVYCSSGVGTVVTSTFPFNYFRRVADNIVPSKIDSNNDVVYYTSNCKNYVPKNGDAKLLAQLIYHEARGEGFNGWAAVGEVVMNRIYSDKFPDTLKDVVYQKGQFENIKNIASVDPGPEMLSCAELVLSGKLRIFNNEDVVYYRNPMITSGISAKDPVPWGKRQYYTCIGGHAFYKLEGT